MTLFNGKYRVETTRLQNWDYTSAGYYFITICTQNSLPFFGNVTNDEMRLSPIGEIVAEEWLKTPQIRSNVELDEWVLMPNHLHGIIVILDVETSRRDVSTQPPRDASTQPPRDASNKPRLQPSSLGSIINQIKSVCTKRIRAAGFLDFAWQTRFYDHIIRDASSLNRIRQYIRDNPQKWEIDKQNPANLHM